MVFRDADTVLVLIDIDDPMTHDKEFVDGIRHSPYAAGGTEICEANRKAIRTMSDNDSDLFANKFVVEVYPDKFGEFITYFLANEKTQRTLTFKTYQFEEEDADFDVEEDIMCAVFEMSSGKEISLILPEDDEDEDDDESEDGSEGEPPVQVFDFTSRKGRTEIDDELESAVSSGRAFSAPSTKVVQ